MTYTGEMVLPRNAVAMDTEEMRYLEGGKPKTRKYTKNQCYNMYALMVATGYTAAGIGLLNKFAGGVLTAAGALGGSKWYKYQSAFKKAGTGKRKGCKVTFKTLTNWKFTYLY